MQPATSQATADACKARAEDLAGVASTGAKVNATWAAHIAMMAKKAMTDPEAYGERWRRMVSEAPKEFAPYTAAAARLAKAPTCPTT